MELFFFDNTYMATRKRNKKVLIYSKINLMCILCINIYFELKNSKQVNNYNLIVAIKAFTRNLRECFYGETIVIYA